MIDDFLGIFDNLIENSKQRYNNNQSTTQKSATWKHCVVLHAAGWKAVSFNRVKEDFCDDAIIVWKKEGKEDIKMRLPFNQQCLWIEYLERKDKDKEKK